MLKSALIIILLVHKETTEALLHGLRNGRSILPLVLHGYHELDPLEVISIDDEVFGRL